MVLMYNFWSLFYKKGSICVTNDHSLKLMNYMYTEPYLDQKIFFRVFISRHPFMKLYK